MSKEEAFGPDIRKLYTYRELPIGATSIGVHDDVIKTGSWRILRPVFQTKTSPCNEACPAGVDVRGFIALAKDGLFDQAHRLYIDENPFPSICGRVCYHPCEDACNRKGFDQAVSINALERFLSDFDSPIEQRHSKDGARVAVVGSGPAGLSSAYFLARLGYEVTVFEEFKAIGGLLRTGIPNYRLPIEVVEKEVERLRALGIQFVTDYRIDEKNWKELGKFDAILLACGAEKHLPLPFTYNETGKKNIFTGLQFLRAVKFGTEVSLGQRVAVIGGGNTAIDAARVSLRLGSSPTIIYRRSREEMPAFKSEVEDALEEDIEILFLASPIGIEEGKSGLTIKCIKNRMGESDESGRPLPFPIEGSEYIVEADSIISAIGEISDLSFLPKEIESSYHSVRVNETGSTNKPGIFACGDFIDQPRSVAHAIGSGKKAAIAIDCYCRGQSNEGLLSTLRIGGKGNVSFERYFSGKTPTESQKVIHFEDLNLSYFQYKNRCEKPKLPKEARKGFEEISGNLSIKQVLGEAQRCFSCGMCYHCDNCYVFCPDGSVLRENDKTYNVFDYEYCKGCGICENECPVGVIEMEKEV